MKTFNPQEDTHMRFRNLAMFLAIFALFLVGALQMGAQSFTTGEITGTVTDPSGAVLPNVTITLKSVEKGNTQSGTTNSQGTYRFSLLSPGNYEISAETPGFKKTTTREAVSVGAVSTTNLKMELGTTGTTVEVSGEAPLLQADSSEISTTMNTLAVQSLPNPGNDLSFIAQTAPGSVMNTQGGYGNFSSFGISATSNLFTMNGMYDNDPFLNLNNSGATNLLLGNNEVQEVDVVSNGYSGQFGGFAGATVNYVTKSGGNQFHGNAAYWWDGRVMNANDWFNNNTTPATPRGFVNANQWAASIGGPIKKDKAFFYFNYEGLRVLVPVSQTVTFPDPAFQAATLTNLAAVGQSAQIPFYQNMFNLWNTAPGVSRATPVAGNNLGCTGGWLGPAIQCADSFQATDSTLTHEYLLAGRFDFNLSSKDKLFIRMQEDKGLQATFTDPINSLFNTVSNQPEYQSQVSWTHSFGTKAVNNFVGSATYYSAIFSNANRSASLAAYPTTLLLGDGSFNDSATGLSLGGIDYNFPQGRNVTQYQFVDDFSFNLGSKNTLKLGENFHRYDIGDHDFGAFASGLLIPFDINSFYNGGTAGVGNACPNCGTELLQNFPANSAVPIAIYGLGWYVQDEWRATPTLKLTFDLRMDHPSDPVCVTNCFARFTTSFDSLNHDPTIPYNQAIAIGQHQAIPNFTKIEWQPRFGFAWSPSGLKNTVLRGGFGIFGDTFPGQIADLLAANSPYDNAFTIVGASPAPGSTGFGCGGALAPAVTGSVFGCASSANAAFVSGFTGGGTIASIGVAPNFNSANVIKVPMYEEWNLQLQQAIGANTSINLNYVGNHGYHESVQDNGVNAGFPGFTGLPATPPDSRFVSVTQVYSAGISNYNGLVVSVQHRFSHGLQVQGSFNWSHALDDISNGGFNPFNFDTNESLFNPLLPNISQLSRNYGNADYDTRKSANLSYVYEVPYRFGPKPVFQGWQISGTMFTRSGLPYTVVDKSSSVALDGAGYGNNTVWASYNGAPQGGCGPGAASATPGGEAQPCVNASAFLPSVNNVTLSNGTTLTATNSFGNQRRNQFFGPGYFDTDLTIMKFFGMPHWEGGKLGIGAQFFNILNHPNFDQPVRDLSNTSQFGQIVRTVNTPTSILGSFLGGDASPRLIQLTAKFNF